MYIYLFIYIFVYIFIYFRHNRQQNHTEKKEMALAISVEHTPSYVMPKLSASNQQFSKWPELLTEKA